VAWRVSDTRHARFPSSRETRYAKYTRIHVYTHIHSRADRRGASEFLLADTSREFYRSDILPNKYEFVGGERQLIARLARSARNYRLPDRN